MGFLTGKRALIVGLLSNRSIAYGSAQAMKREGAELAFTYQIDKFHDRVTNFAHEFGSDIALPCDVSDDAQIDAMFEQLGKRWDGLDIIVHAVSSYSFAALAKAGLPMMLGRNGALLTLSYLGAERTMPNYNVMGLAKASLEANVRYIAQSLGPKGIRVNAVSAGP